MSFLDQAGLSYFYTKIKEKFVRSVNSIVPDASGNIAITNVATADNLTSPDEQTSYGTYIYRTSGGDVSLASGEARLLYIEGNMEISGRQQEIISISATNGLIASVDAATWRASAYGSASGTYNFTYTASTGTWSPLLGTYGVSVTGVHGSTVSASVSGALTSATVNKATWETNITTTGTYIFVYDGEKWTLNSTEVILSNYGIAITGTPEENDTVTVSYSAATPNSSITVNYTKGNLGTISIPKPTSFSATGFNQYNPSTMTLNNMTISNGYITSTQDTSYVCYCKAVGGVTNGYVAYSSGGYITDIGWCAEIPQETSEVIQTNKNVTSTVASIPFDEDGYVVVAVSNTSDICIHPKWSGVADENYEAYTTPSTITFPTNGTLNGSTVTLPLASYGMPAIGNVADRLDLDGGKYIKRIGRYSYSAANLEIVQAMDVPYEYDSNYIYYVLDTPVIYTITTSPVYIVNDWGTEEFIGTTVPVVAQTLYGQNLRDKLRNDVEAKKLSFYDVPVGSYIASATTTSSNISNIAINQTLWSSQITAGGTYVFIYNGSSWALNTTTVDLEDYGITFSGTAANSDTITVIYSFSAGFVADTTYANFGYKKALTLSGVTSTMIPEVIFNTTQAMAGVYAPTVDSYNGGIYLYATEVPIDVFTIPVIICWR